MAERGRPGPGCSPRQRLAGRTRLSRPAGLPAYDAFVWRNGKIGSLGVGALGEAVAINDRGHIIARARRGYVVGTYETEAFLWRNGRARRLGTFGGSYGDPGDINNRGQTVGSAQRRGSQHYEDPYVAFLWRNGKMRRLGTAGGPASHAVDINERGWIVGTADTKRKASTA